MDYYYLRLSDGSFHSSTAKIDDLDYIPLTDAEYRVSRLIVAGHSRVEIERATRKLFDKMKSIKKG